MSLPKLYTLKEAALAFGTAGISIKSLRREVQAGRLKAFRPRPGRTSKILLSEDELNRWLAEEAGQRQFVCVPAATPAAATFSLSRSTHNE